MSGRIVPCVYFAQPGPSNTERVLAIVGQRAMEINIRSIVVATTTGATGVAAVRALPGCRVIAVSHSTGFQAPDIQEMTDENRSAIETAGGIVLTTTHAFGGIGRAVRRKLSTYQIDEVMAYTLRIFGQGLKVAVEITLMAADAGLIRCSEEIIAVAGTGSGADTAAVIKPAHAQDFFDLRVVEVLCKPRFGLQ